MVLSIQQSHRHLSEGSGKKERKKKERKQSFAWSNPLLVSVVLVFLSSEMASADAAAQRTTPTNAVTIEGAMAAATACQTLLFAAEKMNQIDPQTAALIIKRKRTDIPSRRQLSAF